MPHLHSLPMLKAVLNFIARLLGFVPERDISQELGKAEARADDNARAAAVLERQNHALETLQSTDADLRGGKF